MGNTIEITPVVIPLKGTGVKVAVRTIVEGVGATEALIYWQLLTEQDQPILDGNLTLAEEPFEGLTGLSEVLTRIILDEFGNP